MINFMKPEAEVFDSYSYEKPQRLSAADFQLPRLRRSRHDPREPAPHTARAHTRLRSRQLAHHAKRKCSYAMFPFFSHKNKTKPKPPGPKHDKRKSHSFHFSKTKDRFPPSDKREKKNHITEKIEVTTIKDITQNSKLKPAKIVHNSRLYFANPYRIDEGNFGISGASR
ncbi:uncharacterized protein LOC125235146 [Leguminivora glycinivorella]|uniref:uncharacterized protein LOC125235146 n=1 Tax=Leguminivora glycinivorella TaxID=1035111 RepID=UPI00200E95EE|nr:uncharacterized protein LOC125235146 [Leguminivora glycinivorella]